MPTYLITIALTAFSFLCLCARLKAFRDPATLFFVGAIWLRYALAAFPSITYPEVLPGFSVIALMSVAVAALGIVLLRSQALILRQSFPIYPVILAIVISGFLSGFYSATADAFVKWCYLIVLTAAGFLAMRQHGPDRVMRALLIVFVLPLASQVVAFVLNTPKGLDDDHGISYVGTYKHESQFSAIILTYIIAVFLAGPNTRWRIPLLILGFFALTLANYRTAMLAAVPVLIVFPMIFTLRLFVKPQRTFVAVLFGAVFVLFAIFGVQAMQERFSDVFLVLERGASLLKPPSMYTNQEQDIFTARAYIWSSYIYDWMQGSDLVLLFGYGPDSWRDTFANYAHNTFISYLYEFGFCGLTTLICLFLSQLFATRFSPTGADWLRLFAAHCTFLLLCMGTMPLWQIEGVILYAVILSHTWFSRALVFRFVASRPSHLRRGWNLAAEKRQPGFVR